MDPEAQVDFADGANTPLIDHQDGTRLIREIDFVPRPLEEGVRAHINEARLSFGPAGYLAHLPKDICHRSLAPL